MMCVKYKYEVLVLPLANFFVLLIVVPRININELTFEKYF